MTIRYLVQFLAVVSAGCGCLSKETSCTAMETSNGTIYVVHSITGSHCDFYWINSSHHVLANGGGKIEHIISSNSTHLHTHGCYEIVVYYWDCMSEMSSTTATCHVNCTGNPECPSAPGNLPVWLIVVSLLLVILVILFVVCSAALCRWKQQRYTGGKPSNMNQAEVAL